MNDLQKLAQKNSSTTLKVALKTSTTEKMRLKVCRYSQGEYLYLFAPQGFKMRYTT